MRAVFEIVISQDVPLRCNHFWEFSFKKPWIFVVCFPTYRIHPGDLNEPELQKHFLLGFSISLLFLLKLHIFTCVCVQAQATCMAKDTEVTGSCRGRTGKILTPPSPTKIFQNPGNNNLGRFTPKVPKTSEKWSRKTLKVIQPVHVQEWNSWMYWSSQNHSSFTPTKTFLFDESIQKPQQRPDPIFVGGEGKILGACFFLMYPKRTICPHKKNITKPCPHKKPRNTAQHQRNAVCCQQGVEKEKGTPQGWSAKSSKKHLDGGFCLASKSFQP